MEVINVAETSVSGTIRYHFSGDGTLQSLVVSKRGTASRIVKESFKRLRGIMSQSNRFQDHRDSAHARPPSLPAARHSLVSDNGAHETSKSNSPISRDAPFQQWGDRSKNSENFKTVSKKISLIVTNEKIMPTTQQ
jgi:hypothetical protein